MPSLRMGGLHPSRNQIAGNPKTHPRLGPFAAHWHRDAVILSATIDLGSQLGLRVVAEVVERAQQADWWRGKPYGAKARTVLSPSCISGPNSMPWAFTASGAMPARSAARRVWCMVNRVFLSFGLIVMAVVRRGAGRRRKRPRRSWSRVWAFGLKGITIGASPSHGLGQRFEPLSNGFRDRFFGQGGDVLPLIYMGPRDLYARVWQAERCRAA